MLQSDSLGLISPDAYIVRLAVPYGVEILFPLYDFFDRLDSFGTVNGNNKFFWLESFDMPVPARNLF